MLFHHCTIVGLGLLGGSLALDLRRLLPEMTITGVAHREETVTLAKALRHEGTPVFTDATCDITVVRDADLVILCTPVQTILAQMAQITPYLAPGTVVTDVGSTKRTIMNAATALPTGVFFIGGHPMAGSDRAGLTHARTGLFANATWAFCIPPGAEAVAQRLTALVELLGARPLLIDPETHDDLVAMTSHLPHVAAAALTNLVLGSAHGDAVLPFIAGGYRDCTRIAAANPAMWRDILLTNRDRVLVALGGLLDELELWRDAIRSGDAPHLEALLTTAHDRREKLNK